MYRLADSAMMTRVGEEAVLLDSPTGSYYSLDACGTDMLIAALELESESVIANRLMQRFSAESEQLIADFRALMAELEGEGLICSV